MVSGWRVTVVRVSPKPVVRRVSYGTNTVNWGRLLKGLFNAVAAGGFSSITLRDDGGTDRTGYIKEGRTFNGYILDVLVGYTDVASLRVWGRLGTGTTAASRTQHNLVTPAGTYFELASNYDDGDVVTLTGTASFDTPISPTEAGLFIDLGNGEEPGGVAKYMLDRTVFPALPPGTLFTVRWDIELQ